MKLLLDSNVLVRMVRGRVGAQLADVLNDTRNDLFVSMASIWELAVKSAKRDDFDLPADFPARLVAKGCGLLSISVDHAWAVASLPRLHDDPFDRLRVVQALAEGLVLVTSDRKLADYGVAMLRA